MGKSVKAFNKQKVEFHQQSNSRKNASLYVDFIDEKFLAPKEQISEEMLQDIAKSNYEFIELIRPKVEMLTKWAQDPESIKSTLKLFQNITEDLKEKYPDDPSKAMEEMLNTMTEKLTTTK